MKATGEKTKPMEGGDSFMQMEMYTKENGKTIKLMVKDSTLTLMALGMRESGEKINNTGMVLKDGQMELAIRDTMLMEKSMEKASSFGLTKALILVISLITTLKDKVFTSGQMEESTMETGKITKCKAMGLSHGLMEGST